MTKAAHTFNEENIKYLRGFLGDDAVDTFFKIEILKKNTKSYHLSIDAEELETYKKVKACLEEMETFGDNRWWTSEDKRVLGYYQLLTRRALIPFDKFKEAASFLLGRHVGDIELVINYDGLKEEAERAFRRTRHKKS